MIKYIFSDLDNTLLTSEKQISDLDIKAIKYAQDRGVHFLVSTGRLPFCFEEYGDRLNLDSYSACNGAIIKLDGKLINDAHLKREDAIKLVEYAIDKGIYTRIFTFDWLHNLYIERDNVNSLLYKRCSNINETDLRELAKRENIYKICFHNESVTLLKEVKEEIMALNLSVETVFSSPNFLEVCLAGETKGSAILKLCEATNVNVEDTLAMGDAQNDYEMLKTAGISACPVNASEEIKQICDFIADFDSNNGAVAQIIRKFV